MAIRSSWTTELVGT